MRIEHYLKDKRLELALNQDEVLPEGGVGCFLIGFLFIFYLAPLPISLTGDITELFFIVFLFIWYGLLIVFTVAIIIGSRPSPYFLQLTLLSTGECLWKIRSSRKKQITGSFYASEIQAVYISTYQITPKNKLSAGEVEDFNLLLEFKQNNGKTISAILQIFAIDKQEEVIDFGCKLSRILRIRWGNIDENNFGNLAIHFQRATKRPDLPVPIDVYADYHNPEQNKNQSSFPQNAQQFSSSYANDEIPTDQRLDKLITEDWNPDKHEFFAKILSYSPQKYLIYEDTIPKFTIFITATAIALVASGFISVGCLIFDIDISMTRWFILFLSCAFVAYSWFSFKWYLGKYLPEKRELSFIKYTLSYQKGKISKHYNLKEATELVFRLTKTRHTESSSSDSGTRTTYYTYNGITLLLGISGEKELIVGQTGELREQQSKAYKDGVAFTAMLTNNLNIPFRLEMPEN